MDAEHHPEYTVLTMRHGWNTTPNMYVEWFSQRLNFNLLQELKTAVQSLDLQSQFTGEICKKGKKNHTCIPQTFDFLSNYIYFYS